MNYTTPAEDKIYSDYAKFQDDDIEADGLENRMDRLTKNRKRIDYSDKGDHEWYWISPFAQKCKKCQIIKDMLFSKDETEIEHRDKNNKIIKYTYGDVPKIVPSPYYLIDLDKRSFKEPKCTWRGRKGN